MWKQVLADLIEPEIFQKFAAHCAGNVPEEFAARLQDTVCQKTNLHAKNAFAAILLQIVRF